MSRKAPPPFSPTTYGNLQMFPKPIADPAVAAITPNLLPKLSRVERSTFVIMGYLFDFQKLLLLVYSSKKSGKMGKNG
jgi:hypothetical protein